MLLIVANSWDARGVRLREAWHDTGAQLVTPADLSRPGWSFDPSAPTAGYAVVARKRVRVTRLTGVCALLSAVTVVDLPLIAPGDRDYVAAEMTAFLCAWLATLPCPVVNAPSPVSLCGPGWRAERWTATAARLGIPVRNVTRSTSCHGRPLPPADPGTAAETAWTVVLAGDRTFGAGDPPRDAVTWAIALARAAGARLLNVHVGRDADGIFVRGADAWPDVTLPGVPGALLDVLTGQAP